MKTAEYVIWRGAADRMIGKVTATLMSGRVEVERLDGTRCHIDAHRLLPATTEQVLWAIWLGGCTIPPTGNPPDNCL